MKKRAFTGTCTQSVKQGLILAIPFLMFGAFALVLNSFPLAGYQRWLSGFAGGVLSELFTLAYQVTLGSLAFLLAITISYSYGRMIHRDVTIFCVMTSLCSYLAFTGFPLVTSDNIFSAEWVFSSMCITLFSCRLFRLLFHRTSSWTTLHTVGGDFHFNLSIRAFTASSVTVAVFAVTGELLVAVLGGRNILNFGSYLFMALFDHIGDNLLAVLLYVFFSHLLWFFGIHGTNTLEAVSTRLFEQNITINQALIASGQLPSHIYSKTFLDVFVFLGGCGSTLCFILALLLASRKYPNHKLAKLSSIPVLFNINEPAIFGFPIIFNPTMLIPFICTPLLLTLISAAAMKLGLVPPAFASVGWTVPILFSGKIATGSVAGSLLQIFNVAVGTCIYIPFVKLSEQKQVREAVDDIRRLEQDVKAGEQTGQLPELMEGEFRTVNAAKTMIMDINHTMKNGQIKLFYQPQVTAGGSLYGAEALLRWEHPMAGYIYPPLLILLANEGGLLDRLGLYLISLTCHDMEQLWNTFHLPLRVSVNVSPLQLDNPHFVDEVEKITRSCAYGDMTLVFEFTERVALTSSPATEERLKRLQSMGIHISIDDFGMGHGSIMYLNNSLFNEVKLDGSLVRQLTDNPRSREIIQSITSLSETLRFEVVAEYVETEEQVRMLEALGCRIYQGYYFSKALPLQELVRYLSGRLEEKNSPPSS